MYALISILVASGFSRDWIDRSPECFWGCAVLNVLMGIVAARCLRARVFLGVLVLLDAFLGTLACTFKAAFTSGTYGPEDLSHQTQRALIGWLSLVVLVWASYGDRGFHLAMPVRGVWSKRLVAGLALGFAQYSSASGGAVLALAGLPGLDYYSSELKATWSAFACSVTLFCYLAPAWWLVVTAGSRDPRRLKRAAT